MRIHGGQITHKKVFYNMSYYGNARTTTMRSPHTPIRMPKTEIKIVTSPNAGEDEETG